VVFSMTRLIGAAACVSLTLSATRLLPVPYDFATLGVAAFVLYRLVGDCAGRGAACVAAVLLVSSLLPALSGARVGEQVPALALLSLPWWIPLLAGAVVMDGPRLVARPAATALLAWWGIATAVALLAPGAVGAMASFVETAPAAALAGLAVSRLADASSNDARRRRQLAFTLGATCLWQASLVIGTGRPARVLVPMLAAGLMIAVTDLLTNDEGREREAIGAALVIAMLVLGLVPGAHTLVMQQQGQARAVAPPPLTGADAPSSIDAP
jgi:hypothetical protein